MPLDDSDFVRSNYEDFFVAKVTAKTLTSGVYYYAWKEQILDTTTNQYTDAEPARSGTATVSPAIELNNSELTTLDVYVFMRVRGMDAGEVVYEFFHPGGYSGVLSVCEGDGNLHDHTFVNGRLTARS